ncbi:hypothetical protein [uncultured Paludibaculum sp.]|uniref:hypothetical protein n=1 Tax=uncultured Paludibaculum sp. TaxID=1765020 RepID=UPI002AABED9F|nr:hypothetical protein [uncultured Paludibaculum sp.]
MFPGVNGFHWTFGHILFVSIFCTVGLVILTTALVAAWRSWRDARMNREPRIRWQSDFHDLTDRERRCRHMLSGEIQSRLCPNAFECRDCVTHPKFVELEATREPAPMETFGLAFPAANYYHRGHAWVRPEGDGTLVVGLDDLGRRLIGRPDHVQLPAPGTRLENNGTAWRGDRNGVEFRVLAPIEGEVIETGGPDKDWYLRLRPVPNKPTDLRHLLHGSEVSGWLRDELDRLQMLLSPEATGPSLADGGVLMEDLTKAQPSANWDRVMGEMFLEP